MAQMTAVQIGRAGGPFEVVKREVPAPGPNQVRINVEACGICHSDLFVKEGYWPGLQYPRVTGHEVAGVIDEVGSGVIVWKKGQRVGGGVAWRGRVSFLHRPRFSHIDFGFCHSQYGPPQIPSIDGGRHV